jgi:hypothetical protein
MPDVIATREMDGRLVPFLDAATEKEAAHCLEDLLYREVCPIILGVLKHKFGALFSLPNRLQRFPLFQESDTVELFQDVLVQITSLLQRMRRNRDRTPISNLAHYTAATTYQVVNHYYRKRCPRRACLADKLRWLLNSQAELCRWQAEKGEWLVGYRRWQEQAWKNMARDRSDYAARYLLEAPPSEAIARTPTKLLTDIFDWLGHPIRFQDLVTMLVEIWEVREFPNEPLSTDETTPLLVAQVPFTEEIHSRVTLRRYWMALCALPPNQRCCLLLQASDPSGNSLIHMLHTYGIASLAEIAAAAVLPVATLKTIYQELPWEDKTIAIQLQTTPLYVTRLRGMARKRLGQAIQSGEEIRIGG